MPFLDFGESQRGFIVNRYRTAFLTVKIGACLAIVQPVFGLCCCSARAASPETCSPCCKTAPAEPCCSQADSSCDAAEKNCNCCYSAGFVNKYAILNESQRHPLDFNETDAALAGSINQSTIPARDLAVSLADEAGHSHRSFQQWLCVWRN